MIEQASQSFCENGTQDISLHPPLKLKMPWAPQRSKFLSLNEQWLTAHSVCEWGSGCGGQNIF